MVASTRRSVTTHSSIHHARMNMTPVHWSRTSGDFDLILKNREVSDNAFSPSLFSRYRDHVRDHQEHRVYVGWKVASFLWYKHCSTKSEQPTCPPPPTQHGIQKLPYESVGGDGISPAGRAGVRTGSGHYQAEHVFWLIIASLTLTSCSRGTGSRLVARINL